VRYGIILSPKQPFGLRREKRGATHAHPRFRRIKGNTVYLLFNLILLYNYNLLLKYLYGYYTRGIEPGVKVISAFVLISLNRNYLLR
jgi:hypothetical protein